jgi:site-specific recombinase XerD
VAADDGAVAVVQLWLAERARLGFNGRQKLFCTLAGGPLSSNQVRQMVKRRAARAGIDKRVHPHGLRHTHAAELVAEGVPVNVIQKQLGHVCLPAAYRPGRRDRHGPQARVEAVTDRHRHRP